MVSTLHRKLHQWASTKVVTKQYSVYNALITGHCNLGSIFFKQLWLIQSLETNIKRLRTTNEIHFEFHRSILLRYLLYAST
jgi:hypothetical protein